MEEPTPVENETTDIEQVAVTEEAPISVVAPAEAPVEETSKTKRKKPKWFFGAIAAALVLMIAGGAYGYLGVYMQTPENIWKTSLKNTRDGLQAFVDKGPSDKKSLKLNGNFKMSLPTTADGSISGTISGKLSNIKIDAGTSGVRANMELRTVPVSGVDTPDLYLNVSGIKGLAGLVTADANLVSLVDSLDGKWLVADHTLIDKFIESSGVTSSSSGIAGQTPQQLGKDIQDIEKKVAAVINERLLTDDKGKAVVIIKEKLAKEDFKGRKSQHLRVQVQKTQMHDFTVAMKDALKSSKLKEWLLSGDTKQTFEQALNFDTLLKGIDSANYDKAIADVWVDTEFRTIRNVRIYDKPDDKKSFVDFMFDYEGGDEYPFMVNIIADDVTGSQNISIGTTFNRATDKVSYSIVGTGNDKTGKKIIDVTANLTATPSDEELKVEKPAGATNIVNLFGGTLNQLYDMQGQLKVVNPVNSSFLDDTEL